MDGIFAGHIVTFYIFNLVEHVWWSSTKGLATVGLVKKECGSQIGRLKIFGISSYCISTGKIYLRKIMTMLYKNDGDKTH